jgi:hypothetical protein
MRRRRIILAEFAAGAIACPALGIWVLLTASGGWLLIGVWLVGIGINYVPLALHAWSLSKRGALEQAPRMAIRRATVQQLWIALPLAVLIAALDRRA